MKFTRKHKSNIILFVYLALVVIGHFYDIVSELLFATLVSILICSGIYCAVAVRWKISYTKGRRPPIEIVATIRKHS